MPEKREGQGGGAADAPEAAAKLVFHFREVVGPEVRELAALDVAPHELDRVEIRRVAGQALDGEPGALRVQVGLHGATLVRRQAIPHEEDAAATELALEIGQEVDEADVVVAAGARLEEEATAPKVPAKRDREGDGELLPVERVDQDGGLAAGRPRAADRGPLRDAALVLEDNPGPPAPSVFFTAGQRVVIQC